MSQSLVQIYVHLVFSTKRRVPFLSDAKLRERLHAYLVNLCDDLDAPSRKIGGTADHVHILCRLPAVLSPADLVKELKRDSSKWLKTQSGKTRKFYWQSGYGAFSVSPSHLPALERYIENQVEHHRVESFQDEYRRICRKYGVPLDERYVWD